MRPSETLALCEMARSSLPALRCPSIHAQRSFGCFESSALNGATGPLAQSLKNTLRWRFMLLGMDVHSYEQKAVNLPGSFAAFACSMTRFHTSPVIFGSISAGTGGPEASTLTA